ncbi:cellulose biosynthesis protein BcsP [Cupriavidus sp. WKF15]|uniref:cellulose biosynthesis protein BcsP n=1 Tax=Cupriavidus sp. WKF15 TaxID=3032282 RepID=UPI0023E0C0F2|nr:cellulose biosynthesis protein BcsP [Cupriavidus sp. WKF15]WER47320.1 cellulose biosynthesis protein BcsP [Cupriavidus sp. WKF15]
MNQSDDLSKLFSRFSGDSATYREIVREDAAMDAQQRWPLLASLRLLDRSTAVPPVQAPDLAAVTSTVPQEAEAPPPRDSAARPPQGQIPQVMTADSPAVASLRSVPAGATPLVEVFARLKGQPASSVQPERSPSRRSFLDRLKRS